MSLHNEFISGFLDSESTKKKLMEDYLEMGLGEEEAKARIEMTLYAKERFKMEKSKIVGEIPDKNIIIKILLNNREDAEFLLKFFPINEELNAIVGIKIIDFIKKSQGQSLTTKIVSNFPKVEQRAVGLGNWLGGNKDGI